MSERLPNSIPNNHQLEQLDSGLIVAHAQNTKEHPHPVNMFPEDSMAEQQTPHEKTRGIGYTETELGGKPFTVAERLTSKPSTSSNAHSEKVKDVADAQDAVKKALESSADEELGPDEEWVTVGGYTIPGTDEWVPGTERVKRKKAGTSEAAPVKPEASVDSAKAAKKDTTEAAKSAGLEIVDVKADTAEVAKARADVESALAVDLAKDSKHRGKTDYEPNWMHIRSGDSDSKTTRPHKYSKELVLAEKTVKPTEVIYSNGEIGLEYKGGGTQTFDIWANKAARRLDREIVITTQEGEQEVRYMVKGDKLINLTASTPDKMVAVELDMNKRLNDVQFGPNGWDMQGDKEFVIKNISKIEIATKQVNNKHVTGTASPFEAEKKRLGLNARVEYGHRDRMAHKFDNGTEKVAKGSGKLAQKLASPMMKGTEKVGSKLFGRFVRNKSANRNVTPLPEIESIAGEYGSKEALAKIKALQARGEERNKPKAKKKEAAKPEAETREMAAAQKPLSPRLSPAARRVLREVQGKGVVRTSDIPALEERAARSRREGARSQPNVVSVEELRQRQLRQQAEEERKKRDEDTAA